MKLPDKVYNVLKWLCIVFIPALITLYGVIANALDIPYTDTVVTIATGFDTFLGTILGISCINYNARGSDNE